MLDTGADGTIIACSEWPAKWELQLVEGMISGISGITVSMQSKRNFIVEGPEGKLATIRLFVIHERTIVPQQLAIRNDPKTLRDLHSVCGSINWIRPLLGIATEDLAPLFNLLCGNRDLDSPQTHIPDAQDTITKVQEALSARQDHRFEPNLPSSLSFWERPLVSMD
ncbi:hypothetical protein TURU_090073 [Turdus rufiventris]|nr:hypothetical protein TURU_090073 [Turdus rufiventris]